MGFLEYMHFNGIHLKKVDVWIVNRKILLQKEYQLIVSTEKRWWHVRFLPSCTSVICHTLTKSKNCSRLNFWIYTSFVQVHDRAHDLPRHFQTKKGFLSPPYSTLNSNSHLAIENKNKWKIFWKWMLKFKRKSIIYMASKVL